MPPVMLTSSLEVDCAHELSSEIDRHDAWRRSHANHGDVKAARAKYRLGRIIERLVLARLSSVGGEFFDDSLRTQLDWVLTELQEFSKGA